MTAPQSIVSPLTRKNIRFERMMQDQSAAAQEPGQEGQADAGKRRGRKRRKDIRFLRQMAFKQHCEAAGEQFGMTARHRHNAAFAGVESDRGEVRRSIALRSVSIGETESEAPVLIRSSNETVPSGRFDPNAQT